MKANFSINDIIHIQVVSRLADLLFDPAPENRCTRRTHLKAIENAAAIQRVTLDLLRGIPGEGTASPEDN
jgi:hypothetical protein